MHAPQSEVWHRCHVLSRRAFLQLTAAVALARDLQLPAPAHAVEPSLPDATFQAFCDTVLPGRRATKTDLGNDIHPLAIAGVDPEPGAVEADALALAHNPLIGFDTLLAPFLADLEARAGTPFLTLPFDRRTRTCISGFAYDNPSRVLWEAAAAVAFTAFCAAGQNPDQRAEKASGYRVMGLPGAAPHGYRTGFSYKKRLARERTKRGSLG